MKIDPKYAFLHAFFLICPSCPSQNCQNDQKHTLFSNFARFCTPKRCTHVHCLVLKYNPNYMNFFTRTIIFNFKYKCPPGRSLNGWTRNTTFRVQKHKWSVKLNILKGSTPKPRINIGAGPAGIWHDQVLPIFYEVNSHNASQQMTFLRNPLEWRHWYHWLSGIPQHSPQ